MERDKSLKKPIRGGMGFLIVYKKLIFKGIKIAFRIRRIMLILENLKIDYLKKPIKNWKHLVGLGG